MDMNEEVREEVEDVAARTRVVPVTMIVLVLVALATGAAFVFQIDEDASTGTLQDEQGVVEDERPRQPGF